MIRELISCNSHPAAFQASIACGLSTIPTPWDPLLLDCFFKPVKTSLQELISSTCSFLYACCEDASFLHWWSEFLDSFLRLESSCILWQYLHGVVFLRCSTCVMVQCRCSRHSCIGSFMVCRHHLRKSRGPCKQTVSGYKPLLPRLLHCFHCPCGIWKNNIVTDTRPKP